MCVLVWLQQYLLRRISAEEYSLYPVLAAVIVLVPLVATVLTGGLGRYVVDAYAKGDERRVTQIVSTMVPLLLGAALLILAAGSAFAWYVDRVLEVAPERLWDARIMMGLMVLLAAVQLPLTPFGLGLYVRQKFVLSNLITLCTELLRIGLLFVLLFGVSTRVLWVVVASVAANLCGLLVTLVISRRLVPALGFRRSELRWGLAKELASFGAWASVGQLAGTIRTSADPIILNKLATAVDVSCFYLGSIFQRQIHQVVQHVWVPLQPALTAMHATGEKERLRNAYLRGGRYALWASLFLALPLIVFREELMRLYVGEQYRAAATVMALLLMGFPLAYGNAMMLRLAHAMGQPGLPARRQIILQSANFCLTLYLVGVLRMGAVGSALATVLVAAAFQPLLMWPLGLKMAGVSFGTWLRETLGPGFLPALAGAAVLLGFRIFVRPSDWLTLTGCAGLGCVFYAAVLLLFALNQYERRELRSATQVVLMKAMSLVRGC